MVTTLTLPSPAKPTTIASRKAHDYACLRLPFRNHSGSLYGHTLPDNPSLYVVWSYGEHWPLFIYSRDLRRWYANEDKASRTTSKHYGMVRPYPDVDRRSCAWMKQAVTKGLPFILLSHCEEAQGEEGDNQ